MRAARLVGLSSDGRSLVVATDSGEELAIAADDRLRAALRGDRPRLGQLEIEMESVLTPRDIQTRIRAGEDLAEVARVAGIGLDRVERFAAPVLAERDHIARQAMASSVRRRGETSASRNLRTVVNERLLGRGVDLASVDWDSHRMSDGRWAVTATYSSGEVERQARFFYDPPGRFSVAGNDDADWIVGDSSASKGPQPGRRRPAPGEPEGPDGEPTLDLSDELALVRVVQDAPEASNGPSDASAVPATPLRVVAGGWEPAIVVNYPVEPGPAEESTDEPGPPDAPTSIEDRQDEAHEFSDEAAEHDVALHEIPAEAKIGPSPELEPPPKNRRKRASVPSWDEIMFGGPRQR